MNESLEREIAGAERNLRGTDGPRGGKEAPNNVGDVELEREIAGAERNLRGTDGPRGGKEVSAELASMLNDIENAEKDLHGSDEKRNSRFM